MDTVGSVNEHALVLDPEEIADSLPMRTHGDGVFAFGEVACDEVEGVVDGAETAVFRGFVFALNEVVDVGPGDFLDFVGTKVGAPYCEDVV